MFLFFTFLFQFYISRGAILLILSNNRKEIYKTQLSLSFDLLQQGKCREHNYTFLVFISSR